MTPFKFWLLSVTSVTSPVTEQIHLAVAKTHQVLSGLDVLPLVGVDKLFQVPGVGRCNNVVRG